MRTWYLVGVLGVVMLMSCRNNAKDKSQMTIEQYNEIMSRVVAKPGDITDLFPKTAKEIERYADLACDLGKQELQQILAISAEKRTFDNTVRAFDESQAKQYRIAATLQFLSMVSPDEEIRKTAHKCEIKLSQFAVETYMVKPLYQAFLDYLAYTGKAEKRTAQEQYYLDESMKEFKRDGFALPDAQLEEVKALNKELSKIGSDYEQNLNTDNSHIKVTEQELAGVSADFIKHLKKDGELCVVGCDYPTFSEVMQNCTVQQTRKKLYLAFQNRAYPANDEKLKMLIAKRDVLARKLGFSSFAALNYDKCMAGTPERVEEFLQGLAKASAGKAYKELEMLKQEIPAGAQLDDKGRIYPWDLSFIKNAYKKKHFNIDERKIAEYFPMQKALTGMLGIYEEFLNLRFAMVKPDWVWHEDVELIEVKDKATDKLLGYIFLDLYPRANKYNHACCGAVIKGYVGKSAAGDAVRDVPYVGIVLANFPKATADKPALLKHSDVETFFHEFGHAIHGVLGRTELSSAAGTAVKTDFVELPSQMLEEWMWDAAMLKRVSSHYKTGEPLPQELIDNKLALKKFDTGYFVLSQTRLSLISLELFKPGEQKEPARILQQLHEDMFGKLIVYAPDTHMYANFGHLVGYGARYYGYMWSRVFALDAFYKIKEHGLLNYEIGRKWREIVLGSGGSKDPNELLKEFLGRPSNQEAFLKDMGFK